MTATRVAVAVDGVVQGVGFRPFVYRTAVDRGLAGWVRNTGDGVDVELEGDREDIDAFLDALREDAPPLASVERVDVEPADPTGGTGFEIRRSASAAGGSGTVPPDTGVCESCLDDVRDPDSRYHGYWATSCVDCGPRYTVVRSLPYDRDATSMDEFPMCEACREEYEDPADRRYHAQTIACPECGPTLAFETPDGDRVASGGGSSDDGGDAPAGDDAIARATERLRDGDVVAVRGVGGAHLACDATDPDAVAALRDRTGRREKPFAVMAPSLDAVESFADPSPAERSALTDVRRPIVLLSGRGDAAPWLDAVAPGLHTVGAMLPYSALHHLLFDGVDRPLVMTSANRPGEPMCVERGAIARRLGDVVDGILTHDREIVTRCDDSVVRVADGQRRFVRRSRGWTPERLPRPAVGAAGAEPGDGADDGPTVLAVGPERDATVSVTQGDGVLLSQYVGSVDGPETAAYHREVVDHLTDLAGVEPDVIARDLHPGFETTAIADRLTDAYDCDRGPVAVQHHHAHAASLLGEHGVDRAVVVAADGTGYGPDGTIWGGEVLDATRADYERVGGVSQFRLPGGEAAIREPTRLLAALRSDSDRVDDLLAARDAVPDRSAAAAVRRQVRQGVNAPKTSSAGRVLDAASALLDVCTERSYEGQPAMRLESAAVDGSVLDVEVPLRQREAGDGDGGRVFDAARFLDRIDALREDHPVADVAATAQWGLATGLASIAADAAEARGVERVGFTGGVAYNDAITRRIREVVEDRGLAFLGHDRIPPGDGGVSYGQSVVADAVVRGRN